MNLMKTQAKVAIGMAVAKGAGAMMKRGQQGRPSQAGGLLGGLSGGTALAGFRICWAAIWGSAQPGVVFALVAWEGYLRVSAALKEAQQAHKVVLAV